MRNTNLEKEIKDKLIRHSVDPEQEYTKAEVQECLENLRQAVSDDILSRVSMMMLPSVYAGPNLNYLTEHLGMDKDPICCRLKANLSRLNTEILSYKKGVTGEERAKDAVRCLTLDKDVEILYGITLDEDGYKTEYDMIVIAPYGVFAVEVKNYCRDMILTETGMIHKIDDPRRQKNFGEKMLRKEYLLRKELQSIGNIPFNQILLFTNNRYRIVDNYKKIPISYTNTITSDIRQYDTGECYLSPEQIGIIRDQLVEASVPNTGVCSFPTLEIIDDYAMIMAKIEMKLNSPNQKIISKVNRLKRKINNMLEKGPHYADYNSESAH